MTTDDLLMELLVREYPHLASLPRPELMIDRLVEVAWPPYTTPKAR